MKILIDYIDFMNLKDQEEEDDDAKLISDKNPEDLLKQNLDQMIDKMK